MKHFISSLLLQLLAATVVLAAGEDNFYKLGPDSLPQEGVPKGKLIGPATLPCEVYPGTSHTYWVYVPAQYDPSQPAGLMVFNDGQAMIGPGGDVRIPNVMDNLIFRREIPVIITVFINPGRRPDQPEPSSKDWGDRNTNRPTEYNTPDDKYARVIVDELMPVIKKQYNISTDPDMHAIAGASSGAIAAFSVAWERPDQFRKVISVVGSFVNLRGGQVYPERVLAGEKKPIRIFFQDGVNDNRALRGDNYDPDRDWHYQNVRLVEALTKKGYDVNYAWGIGLHGQKQGGAIMPEMMRWLWRDYPRSADAHDKVERSLRFPASQPATKPATQPAGRASSSRAPLHDLAEVLFTTSLLATDPTAKTQPPVTVSETPDGYMLDNGVIAARIDKRSGRVASLLYNGIETLSRTGGYWSHSPASQKMIDAITIDPKANGGQRGEVSMKGVSGGNQMGSGPGGSVIADIEVRYALDRGSSGLYTYCILEHKPEYPATNLGEARFCAKLNDDVFDWLTVDARRNHMAITAYDWDHGTVLNMKEARRMNSGLYQGQVEHKYDLTAVQFDTPAFGWSSTKRHVGLWFVNPSIEYLSGGATKVELCVHRDATFGNDPNAPAPPCLLNYWRGSHYGGSSCAIAAGEHWSKIVGPFVICCNSGETPAAMWNDALATADKESKAWPYEWVNGVDYPHKQQRGTVSGQLVLNDPQAPDARMSHVLIGLAAPDYQATGARGGATTIDWQLDAKHYEFWVKAAEDGRFMIPNIRPGTYTLHAIATGVLGEFAQKEITVSAGQSLDLGALQWKPVRYGRQLWEIGIADRTAAEFRHGDHYWQWGLYNQYPDDFPDDVNFVIGKSDFHRDWNYCQCPRADRPNGTPWTVTFDLKETPRGRATLRLALAATSAKRIDIAVNNQPAGSAGPLRDTATIRRDGIRGYWVEQDVAFDASLLKSGTNVLKLTIPPGNAMSGVEYDYLRLELDDSLAALNPR
jgi:rhamnogalacturonan endolyase